MIFVDTSAWPQRYVCIGVVYMYVYVYIHTYIYIYIYKSYCVYIYTYTYIVDVSVKFTFERSFRVGMYSRVYVCMDACIVIYQQAIGIWTYMYIHIYACMRCIIGKYI